MNDSPVWVHSCRRATIVWVLVACWTALLALAASSDGAVLLSNSGNESGKWETTCSSEIAIQGVSDTSICTSNDDGTVTTPVISTQNSTNGSDASTNASQDAPQTPKPHVTAIPGRLRPLDLPGPELFTAFDTRSKIYNLPGKPTGQEVRTGSVAQINRVTNASTKDAVPLMAEIALLPNLVDRSSIDQVLRLLRNYHSYDQDPDTVDGMTTHEIFVDSPDLGSTGIKVLDSDPQALPERSRLRQRLRSILHPILNERITPFVKEHYPHVCPSKSSNQTTTPTTSTGSLNSQEDRSCTPCFSLIRRYRHGERQSHGTHHDGHALITVVVSLSSYGTDYHGGLYVSTGYGQRQYLALVAGDAVAHQSTLLHGVQVLDLPKDRARHTERWSWILWYRDSVQCHDYSYTWFADCAERDRDAVCLELHATKVGHIPGLSAEQQAEQVLQLNLDAAHLGNGNAAIKIARAYLKLLPSALSYNVTAAAHYYRLAIDSHHPDGHYGLAILHLEALAQRLKSTDRSKLSPKLQQYRDNKLTRVLWHLEQAARLGHAFAMFNVGLAHVYGYGTPHHHIDADLAAAWLIQSGLPEGYYVASLQAASVHDHERAQRYEQRAQNLGHGQPWRRHARRQTGSGGAGGVDLNLPWPAAHDGRRPPIF
jgi:TPR repeat protein